MFYLARVYNNNIRMQGFMTFQQFKDELGSWKQPLQQFVNSKKFQDIYKYVKQQYANHKVYPPAHEIFAAFKITPISKIKAVIVGQDPYHQPGQAHGLCFSVTKGTPIPPSLKNIYKNLQADKSLNFRIPTHGDLTNWAKQGVFLLNATLTVQYDKPNSHAQCGWQDFTSAVIQCINKNCSGVVFFLWGKPAQEKAKKVDKNKHYVLKTSHPSPLSVRAGFETSRHFSQCNSYLQNKGVAPIVWQIQ